MTTVGLVGPSQWTWTCKFCGEAGAPSPPWAAGEKPPSPDSVDLARRASAAGCERLGLHPSSHGFSATQCHRSESSCPCRPGIPHSVQREQGWACQGQSLPLNSPSTGHVYGLGLLWTSLGFLVS